MSAAIAKAALRARFSAAWRLLSLAALAAVAAIAALRRQSRPPPGRCSESAAPAFGGCERSGPSAATSDCGTWRAAGAPCGGWRGFAGARAVVAIVDGRGLAARRPGRGLRHLVPRQRFADLHENVAPGEDEDHEAAQARRHRPALGEQRARPRAVLVGGASPEDGDGNQPQPRCALPAARRFARCRARRELLSPRAAAGTARCASRCVARGPPGRRERRSAAASSRRSSGARGLESPLRSATMSRQREVGRRAIGQDVDDVALGRGFAFGKSLRRR